MNGSTNISDYSDYSNKWTNSFSFNLSGAKLESLKSKTIIGMKCYINEYNLTEDDGEKFKNYLNCLFKAQW